MQREVKLTGLTPGTTYHYRVLDSNRWARAKAPNTRSPPPDQAGSFALPDNRAWEMVSPPDKGGAPVEALTREGGLILASEDGNALTYVVNGALGEEAQGNRSPEWQQVLATRTLQRLELAGHRHAEQQSEGCRRRASAGVPVLHARPVDRARRTGGTGARNRRWRPE